MRPLAVVVLAAVVVPVSAADKNEDKAKEAVVAFLKAAKAKDTDAVMKAVAVPFVKDVDRAPAIVEKPDAVKAYLKEALVDSKLLDKLSIEPMEVMDLPALRKKVTKKSELDLFEKALGGSGFLIIYGKEKAPIAVVLVRVKDGKAQVVGVDLVD